MTGRYNMHQGGIMRHLVLAVLLGLILVTAGCASTDHSSMKMAGNMAGKMAGKMAGDKQMKPNTSNEQRVTRVSINADDVHEDCFEMKEGQTIAYSFEADGLLRYNLHWHSDSGMKNAAQDAGTKSAKGNYTADSDEYYCLMWNNQGQMPVTLRFSYKISK